MRRTEGSRAAAVGRLCAAALSCALAGCLIPEPRTGEYYRATRLFWEPAQQDSWPASVGVWFAHYSLGEFVVGPCIGYPAGMCVYALEGSVFYPLWDTLCLPIDFVVRSRGAVDADFAPDRIQPIRPPPDAIMRELE